MVEGVDGKGRWRRMAPRLLAEMGVPFTGAPPRPMDVTNDKPLTKQMLREAGLATPDWAVPPDWARAGRRPWIVKAALEDASIGLDDGCVVEAGDVPARAAADCLRVSAGAGSRSNMSKAGNSISRVLGSAGRLRILPMAEMRFDRLARRASPASSAMTPNGKKIPIGWRQTVRALRRRARRTGTGGETQSRLRKGLEHFRP